MGQDSKSVNLGFGDSEENGKALELFVLLCLLIRIAPRSLNTFKLGSRIKIKCADLAL
jgi:hypothetical protein